MYIKTLQDIAISDFKKTRKKLYTIQAVYVDMNKPMTEKLKELLNQGKMSGQKHNVAVINMKNTTDSKVLEVKNYFEGAVYGIFNSNNSVFSPETKILLKGTVDELWGVPLKKVMTQYTRIDGTPLTPQDFKPNTVITLQSKPSNDCYAAFVPKNQQVLVQTAWGDVLTANAKGVPHGKGDFIVCNASQDGTPNLTDTWVVNGTVFPSTYAMNSFPNMK